MVQANGFGQHTVWTGVLAEVAILVEGKAGPVRGAPAPLCTRRGHRPRKLAPVQEAALAAHIAAHPDLTLAALQVWLRDELLRQAPRAHPRWSVATHW